MDIVKEEAFEELNNKPIDSVPSVELTLEFAILRLRTTTLSLYARPNNALSPV